MVYGSDRKEKDRPVYFSIMTVMLYEEMKLLVVLSAIGQAASNLSLDIDNSWHDETMEDLAVYFYGAALGLGVLALFSDCFFK